MTDKRKAAALILENLNTFHLAVNLYENIIYERVWTQVYDVIKDFSAENDWTCKCDNLEECAWLAHKEWIYSDETELFWFEFGYKDDSEGGDYSCSDLADLCGLTEYEVGFHFVVGKRTLFGGAKKWNQLYARFQKQVGEAMTKLGFSDLGGGEFFLPVVLDCHKLSAAWADDDFSDALEPVSVALQAVLKSSIAIAELAATAKSEIGEKSA